MKRAQATLHDVGEDLLDMLWGIPIGSPMDGGQSAVEVALVVAEQLYGRASWQYACATFHHAVYGNKGGRRKSFVNTMRRAIRIYRECGGPLNKNSEYDFACHELAEFLVENTPGKNLSEVYRLFSDVVEFARQHGESCLEDDALEYLQATA